MLCANVLEHPVCKLSTLGNVRLQTAPIYKLRELGLNPVCKLRTLGEIEVGTVVQVALADVDRATLDNPNLTVVVVREPASSLTPAS